MNDDSHTDTYFPESQTHFNESPHFCDITSDMNQLREFLRHQYIGAIVIGLLAYQGISALITTIASPVIFFFNSGGTSALSYQKPAMSWSMLLPNAVHGALSLALAYFLLRWLYARTAVVRLEEPEESVE